MKNKKIVGLIGRKDIYYLASAQIREERLGAGWELKRRLIKVETIV